MKVARSFLKAGVPLSKIGCFREMLEETGYRLTDRRHLFDLIPFILKEEEALIKKEIDDQFLGVVFDGTTRHGEAMAVVLQFISSGWSIEQRVVRMQLLSKSMKGEEIARELIHVLSSTYSIRQENLIAAMHDRASVNGAAMRTVKVVYPYILDIGCFSHTIDRVGEQFNTPYLSEFLNSWLMMFSHSAKAKLLWKEQTGKAMGTYSTTRWWSKWEIVQQLMVQFGDIQSFVNNNDDLGGKTRHKLLDFLTDDKKKAMVMVEMAAVVDWGEAFVKATYKLEGDGALAFDTYEIVQAVVTSIQVQNTPNVTAIVKALSPDCSIQAQLQDYAKKCIQTGLDYFAHQLDTSLSVPLSAFKAARLFCPQKVGFLNPTADDLQQLTSFPFITKPILFSLKAELSLYLAKAEGTTSSVDYLQ